MLFEDIRAVYTESRKEYLRRWNQDRFDKGLCRICDQPHREGKILCSDCAAKKAVELQARRDRYEAAGFCIGCGKRTPDAGKQRCSVCLAKSAKQMKGKRVQRQSDGLCTVCGQPAPTGRRLCEVHREALRNDVKARRKKKFDAGICCQCPRLAVVGSGREKMSYCVDCYFKSVARSHFGKTARWKELKALFEKQHVCPIRQVELQIGVDASLDHILHRARGGGEEIENLRWVYCAPDRGYDINRMRGEMSDAEFKEAIRDLYERWARY